MGGLRNASAFETFDRMAGKIEQMEAEAEAAGRARTRSTRATSLAHKFSQLEQTTGADEDLLALKRKMGLAPARAGAGEGARRSARATAGAASASTPPSKKSWPARWPS